MFMITYNIFSKTKTIFMLNLLAPHDLFTSKSHTLKTDWGVWKKWTLKGTIECIPMAFRVCIGILCYIAIFGGVVWGFLYLLYKFLTINC